jgi:hypothetical protein
LRRTLKRDRAIRRKCRSSLLAPNHPVLNFPNKITTKDFEGWKQEQGLYYPGEYDKPLLLFYLQMIKGKPKNGALLIAPYGKGHYIFIQVF